MMTQDESQIEAQQMSQDEDEEDDDDDHDSESSQSHFGEGGEGDNDEGMNRIDSQESLFKDFQGISIILDWNSLKMYQKSLKFLGISRISVTRIKNLKFIAIYSHLVKTNKHSNMDRFLSQLYNFLEFPLLNFFA